MRSVVRRGSLRPAVATVLLLLLMAVIGTAVPFPLFFSLREAMEPQVPPLIQIVRPYIAALVVLGSRGAVFATNVIAPDTVESTLVAAQRIGAFAGMVVAAVAPAWLLVTWSRRRVMPPSARPAPLHNIPIAIAIIWTLVISRPLVGLVGAAIFPTDTWLMLPSVAVAPGVKPKPARWCAHKLHPSMFACEADRISSTTRKDESVDGFAYDGAKCVSAADVERPSCERSTEPQLAPATPPAS